MENENENEKFYEILQKSNDSAIKGITRGIDAVLLNDLKRMSELGVIEIHKTQPDYIFNKDLNSMKVEIGCRLYFKGEETIVNQNKKIEELSVDKCDLIIDFCNWLNKEYDTDLVAVEGFANEYLYQLTNK